MLINCSLPKLKSLLQWDQEILRHTVCKELHYTVYEELHYTVYEELHDTVFEELFGIFCPIRSRNFRSFI